TFLAGLHASSGDVLWSDGLEGRLDAPPIADETGAWYFLLEYAGAADPELVSIDGEGEERWRVPAPVDGPPLAVWDGVVHRAVASLVETDGGAPILDLGYPGPNAATPLL